MTAQEANARLVGDLRTVMRDAEELMRTTSGEASDKVQDLRNRISDTLASAKATAQRLQEKTVEAARNADRVVRTHPYQSIGVAFGVGMLIGFLARRK